MAKPTNTARWASVSGRAEPTAAEKDDGLAEGDGLPNTYMNHQWGIAGDWFAWLHDIFTNGFDQGFFPADDDTYELGDSGHRWTTICATNVDATGVVQAGSKVIPTAAVDLELAAAAGRLQVRNEATAYLPIGCGNPQAATDALTRQYAETFCRCKDVTGQSVSTEAQVVFNDVSQPELARNVTLDTNKFYVTESYCEGVYRVRALVKWIGSDATAGARALVIRKNGGDIETRTDGKPSGELQFAQMLECLVEIADYQNDYIDLAVSSSVPSDGIGFASIEISKISGS